MQHLYGVQSSTNTNTSATNIPAQLSSIATDDRKLSNELQNAISAMSVDICSKNKFFSETSGVRTPNIRVLNALVFF
jgi:hypothetical protein